MLAKFILLLTATIIVATPTWADPAERNVRGIASCYMIEEAARANQLPIAILTRLLWNESRFDPGAISRAGAQGVAQFMPTTANERGLTNPFDPQQAIPRSANLLADLGQRFGNIGLAVAAYNAGPGRVASWLGRPGALPLETSRLVIAVTGRSAEEWAAAGPYIPIPFIASGSRSCVELKALLQNQRSDDIIVDHASLLPGWEGSGRLLPAVGGSGLVRPIMLHSGRLRPELEPSGRKRE